jgi:hypothetical protein
MPTPLPGWDGVTYVASVALPTFRTGDKRDNNEGDNQKPVANPDSATSNSSQALTINVLANDTDPDGNLPLKVVELNQPDSGKGSVSTDGLRVVYTPPAIVPEAFTATFTYRASDAKDAKSDPATVSVSVTAAAANETLAVTSAFVTVRTDNRYTWDISGTTSRFAGNSITVTVTSTAGTLNLGKATLTQVGTGAKWRVLVATSGAGPAPNPTITVKSALGKTITAPISVR